MLARTAVRLVNGRNPPEGRVEVYHKGKWGTVCGNGFQKNDATVICKMLGYQDKYDIIYYYIMMLNTSLYWLRSSHVIFFKT